MRGCVVFMLGVTPCRSQLGLCTPELFTHGLELSPHGLELDLLGLLGRVAAEPGQLGVVQRLLQLLEGCVALLLHRTRSSSAGRLALAHTLQRGADVRTLPLKLRRRGSVRSLQILLGVGAAFAECPVPFLECRTLGSARRQLAFGARRALSEQVHRGLQLCVFLLERGTHLPELV